MSRFQISVLGASALGFVFLAVKPLAGPSPFIIWNASESVPIGWYFVAKRPPKIGEIAVIKPSEWMQMYAAQRGYLPSNVWLLKPIFASHPSVICRFGKHVLVDGKHVAKANHFDKKRRLLPYWKGCRMLKPGEVFVLGKHRDSFDGRYFGAVNRDQVVGTAISFNSVLR
jgi:type IV secretory pathway protease TraF